MTQRPHPDRRRFLQAGSLVLLIGSGQRAVGAGVVAVRIWPAQDYTRVTIESDGPLKVHAVDTDAERLTVDIEGIDLIDGLRELMGKVQGNDPNMGGVRISPDGRARARLTLELKQAVRPQVFQLSPVAPYQHRLVLDLYPLQQVDPLQQLVAQRMRERDAASARAARLLGHALEEPANGSAAGGHHTLGDPLGELIEQREGARVSPPAGATARSGTGSADPPRPSSQAHAPAAAQTERLIIVALDPGHGGEDPGAIGPGGTREKDVVLSIAHKLRERINSARVKGNPLRAYLTRDADFFVPLGTRVQKARRVQADLFVSIHADAFMSPEPAGASVFALSTRGASSATARWMAEKENASDRVGGINVKTRDASVQRALLDMSTTAQIRDSLELGGAMLHEVGRVGRLHKPRVEQAGFAVLKAPDIPSVLVETAFISNPDEERRLRDEAYQDRLADALLRGIVRYFEANPPLARTRAV
ncbi:MAG: N-acetylmuramoyl-L-alanine amidase [Hydrogenophaga sp.]